MSIPLPQTFVICCGCCFAAVTWQRWSSANEGCEVARAVGVCIMPREGIFTKVLKGGIVRPGDDIEILD